MMKKFILFVLILISVSQIASADDLPWVFKYNVWENHSIETIYVTENSKIGIINYENFSDSLPTSTKEVYKNIKAISNPCYDKYGYYITNDGLSYRFSNNNEVVEINQVKNIKNCLKICCGAGFAVALLSDGSVWTWGNNDYGQLGNGTTKRCEDPQRISLSDIVDIEAGWDYAMALDSEGHVYKWGMNNGKGSENILNPSMLKQITGCIKIETDFYGHSYILTNDGTLYAWNARGNDDIFPQRITYIDECIDIDVSIDGIAPLIVTIDNEVWQRPLSRSSTGYDSGILKLPKPTNIRNVIAGLGDCFIDEHGNVWRWTISKDNYWNQGNPEIIVRKDSKMSLKTTHVSFVKRYEMAAKMSKLYEELDGDTGDVMSGIYDDISDSAYQPDIEKCYTYGLMNGTSDTSFSPNKVLRREQVAIIVDRLLKKTGIEATSLKNTSKYVDDEEISSWAKESVYNVSGLFDVEDDIFNPKEYVSAEELDEIIAIILSLR